MDKEYTILHISDLHKSEEDSYKDLMESLRMDCETYEQEGIKKPEIIVVSGDIAEGAEGLDADAKIEKGGVCTVNKRQERGLQSIQNRREQY